MTRLRQRMREDLQRRNYSPDTPNVVSGVERPPAISGVNSNQALKSIGLGATITAISPTYPVA
jgi:hypothetical protein